MAKELKIVQVVFNVLDPDQRAYYEHVQQRMNHSGFIKRLIQRDMDQLTQVSGSPSVSMASITVDNDFTVGGFI